MLIAISTKKTKIINKYFKKITLQLPDEERLRDSYNTIDSKIDDTLAQLKQSTNAIQDDVKKLMFYSALDVAIADTKLFKEELTLLLKIAQALDIKYDNDTSFTKVEEIVKLIERKRRIV